VAQHVVVPAASELDLATCPALADTLGAVPATDAVVVDLGAVRFCDSTGVSTLIHAYNRHLRAGGTLRIDGASPNVELALTLMGVYELLSAKD
jgi:anti-sigma B factor antagonist